MLSFLIAASLSSSSELRRELDSVAAELVSRGYSLQGEIQVEALPTGQLSTHGGLWQPGLIRLRHEPRGTIRFTQHLRHELMHEAWHQTCKDTAPWAAEAAAMAFSGETAGTDSPGTTIPVEFLSHPPGVWQMKDYSNLRRLIDRHGWPMSPCASNPMIQTKRGALKPPSPSVDEPDELLLHLLSARPYEQTPPRQERWPLASLLKLVSAAALRDVPLSELHRALAQSNTAWFMRQRSQIDTLRLRRWFSILPGAPLQAERWLSETRLLMGEGQAITATMMETALLIRQAVLYDPSRFQGFGASLHDDHSTLESWGPRSYPLLKRMKAWAKTGTATDDQGRPLHGWLAVVWPEDQPAFLALIHQKGRRGRDLWPAMETRLLQWYPRYREAIPPVRIQLFSALMPRSWRILQDCPLERTRGDLLQSLCGRLRLLSVSPGSQTERIVQGLLDQQGERPILSTDLWSYVEASWVQEGDQLAPAAAVALQTVLAWNAQQSLLRHGPQRALCDTTHCAVFRGQSRVPLISPAFLAVLADLKRRIHPGQWLMFARGGQENWTRRYRPQFLETRGAPRGLLSIQRQRTKAGDILLQLDGLDEQKQWSCLHSMSRFKLPSCPDSVGWDAGFWIFRGRGETHHHGLSLLEAHALAQEGASTQHILRHAFRITL